MDKKPMMPLGGIKAKHTPFEKAMSQKRLMGMAKPMKNPSELMGFDRGGRKMKKGMGY